MSKATRNARDRRRRHVADSHDLIRVHGRAREQPQGRQRRDPEAPADGVHRRLRLGQELAGVRHDRRGVAAADQRDLQRLRAGLHADAGAARGRRARRADDRDHRRPGADGRRPPLHGRHRHRRQRDAAHPLQPARASRTSARPRRSRSTSPRSAGAGAVTVERGGTTTRERRSFSITGGMCPRCEGRGSVTDFDLTQLYDDSKSLNEGALTIPGYSMDGWYGRIFRGCGFFDPDKPIRKFTKKELARPALQGADQDQGRRHQPDLRGADPADPEVVPVQGRRRDAAAHPGVRGAGGDVHHLSRVRRHPAQRGGPVVEDQEDQHRRRLRDADQRPGRVGARPRRAVGGAAARRAAAHPRLVRGDRAGLPLASTGRRARCRAARRSAPR